MEKDIQVVGKDVDAITGSRQEIALAHPRKEREIYEQALAELEIVPELAARAYYSIPYKDKDGSKVMVQGPSIKAAMALGRRWGNSVNGARVVGDQTDRVIVEGIYHDFQTNYTTLRQISVSKFAKSRKGETYRLSVDRLNLAIQAGMSKAVRNATLATLPEWLVTSYFEKAKQLVISPKTKDKIVKSIQERINDGKNIIVKQFGVTHEDINHHLSNHADSLETDDDILVHIQGVFNQLKDGSASVNEIFAKDDEPKVVKEK